jgi:hypothetical protein
MSTHRRRRLHRTAGLGLLIAVTATGLLGFGTAASAHANIVSGAVSCASPLGSGYQVVWTVSNDWNLSETAQVVAATGGLSSLSALSLSIPASGNGGGGNGLEPYAAVTTVQSLPASASGAIVINVASVYADGFTTVDAGEINLPGNCSAPSTTTTTTTTTTEVTTTTVPAAVSTTTLAALPATSPQVPSTTVANVELGANGVTTPVQPVVAAAHGLAPTKRPPHPTLRANQLGAAKPATPIVEQASFTG